MSSPNVPFLPTEIIEKIIGYAAFKDLKNLRYVCHRFNHVAFRHLFGTSLDLIRQYPDPCSVMRAFTEDTLFRQYIEVLKLYCGESGNLEHYRFTNTGPTHIKELVLVKPRERNWIFDLISITPNLQSLSLWLYPADSFLERLLFTKIPPRLHKLCLSAIEIREDLPSKVILHFKDGLSALFIDKATITNGDLWASALRKYGRELPLLK